MRFKTLVKYFQRGNVCVTGLVGTGKDLLFSNVIARRKAPYCSNINYGGRYAPYDYSYLDIPSGYKELANGNVKRYVCPLPLGTDIYLSDCGIYFPAQYNNELDKHYPALAEYMALCRHVSRNHVHTNCQSIGRIYLKLREMSETFIMCRWAKVIKLPLFKHPIVIQKITLYDKYESCLNRINPCRLRVPLMGSKEARMNAKIYRDNFYNQHGTVKNKLLIYKHKSKYDTHHFYKLFAEGVNDNEKAIKNNPCNT